MAEKTPGRKKSSTPKKPAKAPIPFQSGIAPSPSAGQAENSRASEPVPVIQEEIRRRAYEFYEARGRHDGFQEEDWVRAEIEILAKYRTRTA